MPENEFPDIDILLERIVDLTREERLKLVGLKNQTLQEPSVVYGKSVSENFGATNEDIPDTIKDIDQKIETSTDLENVYLLKKIKNGLEDSMAGRGITIEEMQVKIDSWFK